MGEMDLKKAEYYTNRELSWLGFNNRILGEARDASLPLFERLKFLSITASNLDEFFMIRVASLKDMVHAGYTKKDISGMTASEQLKKILKETHELVDLQYSTYNRSLIPALKKRGLKIISEHESLSEEQKKFVDAYFEEADGLILVDYKTDRVEKGAEEEVLQKYAPQLNYYTEALEQLTGRKVKEKILYSLHLQKELS